MNKCLKITFKGPVPEGYLSSNVLKIARERMLEGTAQVIEGGSRVRIIIHGERDDVEDFLDDLYKGTKNFIPEEIEVEPHIKDKDYRGVFRILE